MTPEIRPETVTLAAAIIHLRESECIAKEAGWPVTAWLIRRLYRKMGG